MVIALAAAEAAARAARIALVVSDNDGVMTDGTVYVSATGEDMKAYSVRDGMGVTHMSDHVSWGLYIANFTFLGRIIH